MPINLPAPGSRRYQARDRRFTVHLDAVGEAALLELAQSRGEPPGRVATFLVEAGMAELTRSRMETTGEGAA